MFFYVEVVEGMEFIRYKIIKDKEGIELKEFGSIYIKDNMIYVF